MTTDRESGLILTGLDGSNPVAFLAALGTLRALSLAWASEDVRLSWRVSQGAWRPAIDVSSDRSSGAAIVEALMPVLAEMIDYPAFEQLGDNLSVPSGTFRTYAGDAANRANTQRDRRWADFAAAFACDGIVERDSDDDIVQDTALRTMRGAGHQHFLKFMRNIIARTTAAHLETALFRPWEYGDPVENFTLRWDPLDDQRYALRWRNPSGDPTRKLRGSVLGANRLAIEGMPLMPTAPGRRDLVTTGFTGTRSRDTFWTWPIWNVPLSLDSVRSLVATRELLRESPRRDRLAARGIVEVYRSQRITVGKVRNFTPAYSV